MNEEEKKEKTILSEQPDKCGPQPPRPTYYSPQSVRDAWTQWQMCKAGVS